LLVGGACRSVIADVEPVAVALKAPAVCVPACAARIAVSVASGSRVRAFASFRSVQGCRVKAIGGADFMSNTAVPNGSVRSAAGSKIGTFEVVVEVDRRPSGPRLLEVESSSPWPISRDRSSRSLALEPPPRMTLTIAAF
jgi:hypothetical protein